MAIERRIDTDVWDDTWFSELPVDGKLLFLHLLTNRRTSSCGAYEVSIRQMAFETGIDAGRASELITSFGDRIQWWPEHQIVFVRNFYRRQKPNPSYTANARKAVRELPQAVQDSVCATYPELCDVEDTLSSIEETPEDTLPTPATHPVDSIPLVRALSTRAKELGVAGELERVLEPEKEPEKEPAVEARVTAPPPAAVMATAEALCLAPWIQDDPSAVERATARSFALVPDFNTRDGPVEAEKFVRRNAKKPPDDWYRTWLNSIKNAVKYEQERQAERPGLNGRLATTQMGHDAVDAVGSIVRRHTG